MKHLILGQLENDGGCFIGSVSLNGTSIPLRVDPEDAGADRALDLAAVIASSLASYDGVAREVVVRDLLETYNSGWNEYDEIREDGSIESVINPKLDPAEFKSRLILSSLDVSGDSCVHLWYADGGLFWGHSIFVQSLEGDDFSDAQAQLFG